MPEWNRGNRRTLQASVKRNKCRFKLKMAFVLGLDSVHGSRFSARTLLKDLHLRQHSLFSDGLLVALLWVSLLMSTDLVAGKSSAIRRIQNIHPYHFHHWSPSKEGPDYDYIIEASPDEDEDEEPPRLLPAPDIGHRPPPPIPQRPVPRYPPQRPPLPGRRRPPGIRPTEYYPRPSSSTDPGGGLPPTTQSFNGNFHISRDQFVPFEPDDARTTRPSRIGTNAQTGNFRPPEQTLSFVSPSDGFTPSGPPVQHMGVAQAGINRERIRFTTPEEDERDDEEDDTVTPVDDRSLYYSPPAPTTTIGPVYVPTGVNRNGSRDRTLGDDPRLGKDGSRISPPETDPLQYKRWQKEPPPVTIRTPPVLHGSNGMTETYYPSEFTSQNPYWTDHSRTTTPHSVYALDRPDSRDGPPGVHRPDSRDEPPVINRPDNRDPEEESEDPTDPTDHERYVNWPTVISVSSRPSTTDRRPPTDLETTSVTRSGSEIGSSEQPVSESDRKTRTLSTGAIAGIAIGILAPLALVAGAMAYVVYGRHFKNVTHKADGRGSLAERGSYIDDSVRPSGYMNSHIELPKESSEEMTSLDNDSFLNSLEAVTIQNYWAESAKNTKV